MLALHSDRPVKMVYSREESFVGHVHRHPAKIWAEHRADRDGKLVCVRMRILLDGGAYASSSTAVTSNAAAFEATAVEEDAYAPPSSRIRMRTLTSRPSRVARCSAQILAGWRWMWPTNDSSRL